MLSNNDLTLYNSILVELYEYAKKGEPILYAPGHAEAVLIDLVRDDLVYTIARDEIPGTLNAVTLYAISKTGKILLNTLPAEYHDNPYGWYLEKKRVQDEIEKARIEQTDSKLEFDLKSAKRMHKTYWWTFSFAVIGLLISLILLVLKMFGK